MTPQQRREELEAIADPRNTVYFSAASVWELEMKAAAGRLYLPHGWIESAETTGFREVAITAADTRRSAHLPRHHGDPFDRLLIAQAIDRGSQIVTRDRMIPVYDVPVLEA